MKYQEMETKLKDGLKNLNPVCKKSFLIAFVLINLAFLFHTVNFMFGDHDWNYIRTPNYWHEGAFEGRPLHFVMQSLFFGGHVLPILNNLLSFAFLALSGILLAHYWRVPKKTFQLTLFATFTAILPYTLVWLFYAKDMLSNLSLPFVVVAGLLLADRPYKKIWYHVAALFLFYFAFASYAAVLNLMGVCLLGAILTTYIGSKSNIAKVVRQKLPAAADIIIAGILYKLTLAFSSVTTEYNTQTLGVMYWPEKLKETVTVMFTQFVTPLPFMEYKFKLLLLGLCIFAMVVALLKGGIKKAPAIIVLIIAILLSSKVAFFLADERGQVLAEMENFAFVPRLDFYGLGYIYALAVALILSLSKGKWYKLGATLAVIIAFMSAVRDMYAEKVWKLGFDAEMKTHERIVARLEQHPNFHSTQKYRLLQVGSFSLRKNYYRKAAGEETSLDLLETSFTPQFMSRIVYNFYYPEDVFYNNATAEDLSERGKEYLRYQAKPWPSAESIFIDGDIVIIVLTNEGLDKARNK